jgi:hypothetical protein
MKFSYGHFSRNGDNQRITWTGTRGLTYLHARSAVRIVKPRSRSCCPSRSFHFLASGFLTTLGDQLSGSDSPGRTAGKHTRTSLDLAAKADQMHLSGIFHDENKPITTIQLHTFAYAGGKDNPAPLAQLNVLDFIRRL